MKQNIQQKQNNHIRRRQRTRGRQRNATNRVEQQNNDAFPAVFSNVEVAAAALEHDVQRRAETAEEYAHNIEQAVENSRQARDPNFVAISTDRLGQNSAGWKKILPIVITAFYLEEIYSYSYMI